MRDPTKRDTRRRLGARVGAGLGALIVTAAGAAQAAPADARGLSSAAVAESTGWRSRILNVPGSHASPRTVSVDGDAGTVVDAEALLRGGGAKLTTTKAGGARIVVDFGLLVSGFVEIQVRDATAPVRLSYSENQSRLGPEGDSAPNPSDFFYGGRTLAPEDAPDGRADVFPAAAGAATLTSPGLRGAQRFIAITLDGPGSVTVDAIRVRQTNYPGAYDGYFLSNDETLNRIWYASAYGLNLSTARDLRSGQPGIWAIMDGPKRDRVAYAGDLELVARAAYLQDQAYFAIVRDTLNLFACRGPADGTLPVVGMIGSPCPIGAERGVKDPGPAPLPSEALPVRLDTFSALWIVALDDYVRFSGDRDFAREVMPVARGVMKFFNETAGPDGLWSSEDYGGKTAMNWHTPDKAQGIGGYDNEIYHQALVSLARLERAVAKDEAAARRLESRAAVVRKAILAKLWDPAAGAMRLNLSDPMGDHSADANAAALRWRLLDPDQGRRVADFLRDRLTTRFGLANSQFPNNPYMARYISPYVESQATMGLFEYGRGVQALDMFRRSFAHMIAQEPGVPWEEMSVDGTAIVPRPGTPLDTGTDIGLSHAWSTAVPALSTYVLGIQPTSDGYRTWSVAPQPADLAWAEGRVPTPHGPISSRWKFDAGAESFVLTVEAPAGTKGAVAVPLLGKSRAIAMDGRTVWADGRAQGVSGKVVNDAVVFTGITGRRTFAWSGGGSR